MSRYRILQVFNRYMKIGGEERSVDRIYQHLTENHTVERCFFDSHAWVGQIAPRKREQVRMMLYNRESRAQLEAKIADFKPNILLFHNIFPVGSPSLYHAAILNNLPVIQYVHNFRPFSVSGTLYANGRITEEGLEGKYWKEVMFGAWQGSIFKSAMMSIVLTRLQKSGWLEAVKAWVCVSQFMHDKFLTTGLPEERIFTLPHCWEPRSLNLDSVDKGYYLFMARLVDSKGVEVVLQAWHALVDKLGDKTPFLWICGEGPLAKKVIKASQNNPKIRYRSRVDDPEKTEILSHCRALIVPSTWWEPLGIVVYEAYDLAKPVLAAASGGLTETIQHGVTGFLHTPGQVQELIQSVLATEALSLQERAAMGVAGREWLLENASVTVWKQKFEKILESIMLDAVKV